MTAESHPRGFRHVRKVRETGRSAARSAGGLGRARRVGLGGSGGGFAGAALAGAAWRKRGASKRATSQAMVAAGVLKRTRPRTRTKRV